MHSYISYILDGVIKRIKPICKNVYLKRPSALPNQVKEMVVVSLPANFDDKYVCQTSTLRIEIITKNKGGDVPNIHGCEKLSNSITSLFPIVDPRYSITKPIVVLKGSDTLGFTIWAIQAKIMVNTTDSYK